MIRYDLLSEPLISITSPQEASTRTLSLPDLFAALVRDEVEDFPALRPHQRHVWHAFLVQVGALALHNAGATSMRDAPDTASAWRALLHALAPESAHEGAWALVAPPERAALLQPPCAGADAKKAKRVDSPDSLDMLVTSRNHDVKRGVMRRASAEHWLYALVSLQTQEGFLGQGNYGISRMNGGFSSRAGFGIVPSGRVGRRVKRDLECLLRVRNELLEASPHFKTVGGVALLWLLPWDGTTSLTLSHLDPYYVEICRRVRLHLTDDGRLEAMCWSSKVARLQSDALRGRTGDPWAPVVRDATGAKALTFERTTVTYRRLTPLLFPRSSDPMAAQRAPLQRVFPSDDPAGLSLSVIGLVRGQGATDGLHTRSVPVSNTRRSFMAAEATDPISSLAHERVRLAGEFVRTVFYPAALAVFTAAPGATERDRDDDSAKSRTSAWCRTFEQAIDSDFFERLDEEAGAATPEIALHLRRAWFEDLGARGRDVLRTLLHSAPDAAMRHYRVRVKATDRYEAAFVRYLRDAGFEPAWRVEASDADNQDSPSRNHDE